MVFANLTAGLAQMWANKRMLIIFYLTNLLFGLMVIVPFYAAVSNYIGNSLMGEKLGGKFSIDFIIELIVNDSSFGFTTLIMMFVGFTLYLLTNLFLSGGAFATFAGSGQYNSSEFWGNAASHFGRFFRLFLWTLPAIFAFFMLQFLLKGLQNLIFGADAYQYITYWGNWIRLALRGVFIMIFFLILDYGRIYTVITGETVMRNAAWQGIKFTFANFRRTFTLGFAVFLLGVIGLVIYNPVANLFSAPNAFVILLLFIWQQLFIIFRSALRISLYSGETHLYKGLIGDIPPAVVATETPPADDQNLEEKQKDDGEDLIPQPES